MKKIRLLGGLLLLMMTLLPASAAHAEEVPKNEDIPVTAEYFPDEWLLRRAAWYDKNKDEILSSDELEAVTTFWCSSDITDFSQLQYFTNLRELTVEEEDELSKYGIWVGETIDLTVFPKLEDVRLFLDSRKAPDGAADIQIKVSGLEHLKSILVYDEGLFGSRSYNGTDARIGVIDLQGTSELENVSIFDAKGVVFDNTNRLKKIHLSNIAEISNDQFQGFGMLETLSVYSDRPEFTQINCAGFDSLKDLTLNNQYLQTAEISGLDALEKVQIQSDALETIDFSESPHLKWLTLECPKLKEANLAAADALERVEIQSDVLDTINVSKNTKLDSLTIQADRLKALDISKNKKLESLTVKSDLIKKLDLTANKELGGLSVTCSKLESLDISANKDLRGLVIEKTPLKSLDLSKQKELWRLSFQNNKRVTSLDLSRNTQIGDLCVNNTSVKSIDTSKMKELSRLEMTGNKKLTKLDLSKNKRLQVVNVKNNALKTLKLARKVKAYSLDCSKNKLTKLTVSELPDLENLNCSENKLSKLDLSKNKVLFSVDARGNELKTLKIGPKQYMEELDCSKNKLTSLTLTGTVRLRDLICDKKVKVKGYRGGIRRV